MTRGEAVKKLNDIYEEMRAAESLARQKREDEACERIPELNGLLAKRAALPLQTLKQIMAERSRSGELSEQMKNEGLALNRMIRRKLIEAGYPEDYISTRYRCVKCGDTGYLRSGKTTVPCSCFEQKLRELLRSDELNAVSADQTFESFSLDVFPDIAQGDRPSQRVFMSNLRDACEDYADYFPTPYRANMILSGSPGTGKTFLLNCIANRVMQRGFEALLVTAYQLLETMRAKHLHMEESEEAFDRLLTVELLLIDDLGSEPILRNISREYLFMLINERTTKGRNTVIACNLDPIQFRDIYGDRVMSRLCDRRLFDFVQIIGKDIRRL